MSKLNKTTHSVAKGLATSIAENANGGMTLVELASGCPIPVPVGPVANVKPCLSPWQNVLSCSISGRNVEDGHPAPELRKRNQHGNQHRHQHGYACPKTGL